MIHSYKNESKGGGADNYLPARTKRQIKPHLGNTEMYSIDFEGILFEMEIYSLRCEGIFFELEIYSLRCEGIFFGMTIYSLRFVGIFFEIEIYSLRFEGILFGLKIYSLKFGGIFFGTEKLRIKFKGLYFDLEIQSLRFQTGSAILFSPETGSDVFKLPRVILSIEALVGRWLFEGTKMFEIRPYLDVVEVCLVDG